MDALKEVRNIVALSVHFSYRRVRQKGFKDDVPNAGRGWRKKLRQEPW